MITPARLRSASWRRAVATAKAAGSTSFSHPSRVPSDLSVSLVFFVSGAAGLIFEFVWFHRSGLLFGNSIWATSLVLSSFMGGLALGGALAGCFGHRSVRLLLTYAALEAVVAVTGLAVSFGLPHLTSILHPAIGVALDRPWLGNLIRFGAAFAILLVPATAMGATLPVLVGALCRLGPGRRDVADTRSRASLDVARGAESGFGQALGRLYGWNTLGAVAGVVGAELFFIARLGVSGSAWIAALLNSGAAGAALWMSQRAGKEADISRPAPRGLKFPSRTTWPLLACAFLAGAALLALEVVWFRFLSSFVIVTTLALSLMLGVVLAAIGLGGLAASSWLKHAPQRWTYLPVIAFAACCASAVAYQTFRFLTEGTQVGEWHRMLWFACSLTVSTSFLSGVLFTFIGEALKHRIALETPAAGWLTLANTLGAMCGALVATFVLLPGLGMERSFFALALAYAAIGFLARPPSPWLRPASVHWIRRTMAWPRRSSSVGGRAATKRSGVGRETLPLEARTGSRTFWVAATLAAVILATFPFGLMSDVYFPRSGAIYMQDGAKLVATREGPTETIFLLRREWMGQPLYQRLITNGFSMSGTALGARRYMRYFVYWPAMLRHEALQRVLVICYGVGTTAGAARDLPWVKSIDVVEISRDIVAMSDVIYSPEEHPLRDPRVRLHIEDGRHFLQVTRERFDLITGEPPPPPAPGTATLYSREYFELIYNRLTDGGITTYWLPVARSVGYDTGAVIRAFCEVFEDCSLWNATPFDLMLVGMRQATGDVSKEQFARLWSEPRVLPGLRDAGFELPQQIGATFLGDAAYLRRLTEDTAPLTDDYPQRILLRAGTESLADPSYDVNPRARELHRAVLDPDRARRTFQSSEQFRRLWPADLATETLPFFDYQRMLNRVLWEGGNPLRYIDELHAVLTRTPLRRLALWMLGSDDVQQNIAETADDPTGNVDYVIGVRALAARNYDGAAAFFAQAERRGLRHPTTRPLLVYALCLAGRLEQAKQLARDGGTVGANDIDSRAYWNWLRSTFGIDSAPAEASPKFP